MAVSRIVLLLVAVVVGVAIAADMDAAVGDVSVKVLGRSGKFVLTRGNSSLTFEFDYMTEMDSAGEAVGTTGSEKHSFNSFASKDFTFSPKNDNAEYSGVKAVGLDFNAALLDNDKGKLKITMLIFKEAGNVTSGNSTYMVKKGDLKFNIELKDWCYCGECTCTKGQTDQVGEYIELGITLKSPKDAKKATGQADDNVAKFILGENEAMYMTNEIMVDGTATTMKKGVYPAVVQNGAKQTVKIQLLKGATVVYDPVCTLQDLIDWVDGGDDINGASSVVASLLTLLLATLSALY